MSVVASRLQPNNSITKLNGHHLTNGSTPKSKGNGSGSASLIENMLAAKQHFGEPVGKNTLDLKSGVREVLPGPRSPKANGHGHLPNGNGKMNGNGKHDIGQGGSEGEEDEGEEDESSKSSTPSKDADAQGSSSSTLIGPTLPPHLSTPSRKGKEPASSSAASSPFTPLPAAPRTPRAAATPSLYEDPIDLTWPTHLRARKQSAAGLYNPSMACYANATLQVLLHTPPVLRIAQSHVIADCMWSFNNYIT